MLKKLAKNKFKQLSSVRSLSPTLNLVGRFNLSFLISHRLIVSLIVESSTYHR